MTERMSKAAASAACSALKGTVHCSSAGAVRSQTRSSGDERSSGSAIVTAVRGAWQRDDFAARFAAPAGVAEAAPQRADTARLVAARESGGRAAATKRTLINTHRDATARGSIVPAPQTQSKYVSNTHTQQVHTRGRREEIEKENVTSRTYPGSHTHLPSKQSPRIVHALGQGRDGGAAPCGVGDDAVALLIGLSRCVSAPS